MQPLRTKICVSALAAIIGLTGAAPLAAAPMFQPKAPAVSSDVTQVQYRERRDGRHHMRRQFRRDGDRAWLNGHRGYRHQRRNYREYNGFWFPAGAFVAGAILGGALADQPAPRYRSRYGNAHVEWCYDRYRSYRAYDNTFQPYNGPRRQCYSPYS